MLCNCQAWSLQLAAFLFYFRMIFRIILNCLKLGALTSGVEAQRQLFTGAPGLRPVSRAHWSQVHSVSLGRVCRSLFWYDWQTPKQPQVEWTRDQSDPRSNCKESSSYNNWTRDQAWQDKVDRPCNHALILLAFVGASPQKIYSLLRR